MNTTLAPDASRPSLPTGLSGSQLGPFRILEPIGRGGMAMVYLAYQTDMDRLVALKVLFDHVAQDSVAIERFKQEARVIARLEHRNIVPIYDFGQENDSLYLAMRYIRAGSAQEVIARGRLPVQDISSLITEVAAALDYAHARGIIHRDIKPGNILVDTDGHAYLTDFGLAKVLDETRQLTHTSLALGTPAYMALEQTLGRPITPQTDIYALGVMLYEMLTGQAPFSGETPMSVAMMHVRGAPRPPTELDPSIPPAIERVVLRAMAREPADRHKTAGHMAAMLAQAVEANTRAQPAYLPIIAKQLAAGKGPEEVTVGIRRTLHSQDLVVRRKRALGVAPWIAAGVLVLGLATVLVMNISAKSASRGVAARTSTAVALLYDQLNGAQTAMAAGAAGSESTLAFLQTRLAAIPVTGGNAAEDGGQETPGPQTSVTFTPTQHLAAGGPLATATRTSPFLPTNTPGGPTVTPGGPTITAQPTNTGAVPTATSQPTNTGIVPDATSQPADTSVPPTSVPPTAVPPTAVPPTAVPPPQPTKTPGPPPRTPDPTHTKNPSHTPSH